MRHLRWIVLLFCFTVEIRVRAEECFQQPTPCVIKGRKVLKAENVKMVLGEGAMVEQTTTGNLYLVHGDAYLDMSKVIKVRTPYALIWCEGACRGILSRGQRDVEVKSLSGEWRIRRTGDREVYQMIVGSRLKITEVTSDGVAGMSFPQALPWLPTVKAWAKLFPGNFEEFKEQATEFRAVWKGAVEELSRTNEESAARAIASWQKTLAIEQARRLAEKRESAELRRLFREKNYLSP